MSFLKRSSPSEPALYGGIDLGGTKIQTVVVDQDFEILATRKRPTPPEGGPQAVIDAMAETLQTAASEAGVETSAFAGIGVGVPGDVDAKAGTLSGGGNVVAWEGGTHPVVGPLSEHLGAPVKLGNDVQCATNAEFELGSGKDFDTVLGVFWGTGVGGGLVLDGKEWIGRGAAVEIGHVVYEPGGAKCGCGRKGCMEAYAGRKMMEKKARSEQESGAKTDLFKIMADRDKDRLTSAVWKQAVDSGDKLANQLLDRAIAAIGTAVASAANIIDPEAIIIGGGMGDRFFPTHGDALIEQVMKNLFTSDRPPAILPTKLIDYSGAVGAALLVR